MSTTLVGGPNGLARLDLAGVMSTAELPESFGGEHPDLAAHDALGLATDSALALKADIHSHPYATTSHAHVDGTCRQDSRGMPK